MPITEQQLLQIMPNAGPRVGVFVPVINAAMKRWQINTPKRVAAFLAQIGHESSQLRNIREIWGPTPEQARYDLRTDLGNTPQADGDGQRYRGRGLIQITGRANFWWVKELNGLADQGRFADITRRINGGLNGQKERLALWSRATEVLA